MTFASVGLFRKNIENAIYPKIYKTATFLGVTFNDDVETWENQLLELNLQYGWENGIYFAGNITLTDGKSTFEPTDDGFRKLADEAFNISLGYDEGPWDVRLAANQSIWIGCLMRVTILMMFQKIILGSSITTFK